ncbi:agenet domain-containing protein [Thalictrum thalictroides]|uniref:Agenet domain-containing protein n=1 Tax=Thalictrum thalictroides TaxID=46969 RepID=A0A7J6WZZ5_THATH|nr:agenet domain-containing protein [Thalictrum thalictroides]
MAQKTKFKRGDSVEISIKEDGFHGSYFVADVISPLNDHEYIIEFKTLLNDDETKLLKDIVDVENVRPLPPQIPVSSGFVLYQEVDVYDNEGWWVGMVTGRNGLIYYVYFASTNEEIAYPAYRLRLHQEWKDGEWVVLSKRRK